MGIFYSKQEDEKKYVVPIGHEISTYIRKSIRKEADVYVSNVSLFPEELVVICLEYIGFVIHSNILAYNEQNALYQLLITHQNEKQMKIIIKNRITYFDLLYRATINNDDKKHNNYSMFTKCMNKANLVMIFETVYSHVFAVYFHHPIKYIYNPHKDHCRLNHHKINNGEYGDENMALLLLRSHFIYGVHSIKHMHLSYKTCPRIIKPKEKYHESDETNVTKWDPKWCLLQGVFCNVEHPPSIHVSMLGFYIAEGESIASSCFESMDFVGNEMCGGPKFNDSWPATDFKEVEVYQLL